MVPGIIHRDDSIDTVARLTTVARDKYTAAFRSHTGRWEPLPGSAGDMKQTAELVTTLLAPYDELAQLSPREIGARLRMALGRAAIRTLDTGAPGVIRLDDLGQRRKVKRRVGFV